MPAIAPGLFTDEPAPRLIGGRDRATGRIVFPKPEAGNFEPFPLKREGALWSWTVQRYRPKSPPYTGPEAFAPWAIGYVELAGETIVEARLVNVAFEDIAIGMPMRLAAATLDPADPQSPLIPAFEPAGAA